MAPSFLVVGATGNTGQSVVETLSKLSASIDAFSNWGILALTRSSNGFAAQRLAKLPNVVVVEQNWTEITSAWLRQHNVSRAYIASHNQPNQFAEESTFHIAALNAGVDYVVRISTTAANVRPDCLAYYPRTHWAIEAMLSTPEFERLRWTSLQPNVFTQFWVANAAELIRSYRKTGKQPTLNLVASEDAPVGPIDSNEVGFLAAHLLLTGDVSRHNKAKYVLNGPEDITGRQIVGMVEEAIGTKVEKVSFKDLSFLEYMAAQSSESRNVISSIRHAVEASYRGECRASSTSKEVLELAAPKRTPAEILRALLE
ncbi:hypothetical protein HJFPF1_05576 [Paramyrothecium foliicola]|nr:hypothetical protein HJFPF1_05576 [Paramyrothecium foliicola]